MRSAWVLLLLLVLASGCTPELNWRESRPQGSDARLMFPCRPASHARRVALAGGEVEMTMVACSAGQTVFALSFAEVKDPLRVDPALDELARALRSHIRAPAGAASRPAVVPGMTPQRHALDWRQEGTLPDGRTVQERAVVFSRGSVVYQATMLGPRLDEEAQEQFFGALRVGP